MDGIFLVFIFSLKADLKRAAKFCEDRNTRFATGTVTQIKETGVDVSHYFAVYAFFVHDISFSGEFHIENHGAYCVGTGVKIAYHQENPNQNMCMEDMKYTRKLIPNYRNLIVSGNLFLLGIYFLVFSYLCIK